MLAAGLSLVVAALDGTDSCGLMTLCTGTDICCAAPANDAAPSGSPSAPAHHGCECCQPVSAIVPVVVWHPPVVHPIAAALPGFQDGGPRPASCIFRPPIA